MHLFASLYASPLPITFSIPECKIVENIPQKTRDFAFIIPGKLDTYIYNEEASYYDDYKRSYFAVTCKKGGWDCLRHYEILANGCIPYFLNLDSCDPDTLYFLPRDLIKEAMNLEGVSYLNIDHSKFNIEKYNQILRKLLDYTRRTLSTKAMATYVLKKMAYSQGKVLFLSSDPRPDYLRCLTLIGLKEVLGSELVVDFPKIQHIYKTYSGNIRDLYGKGISYTKIVDDPPIDRSNIEQKIINKEFSLIVYGSIHRGTPFYELVHTVYPQDQILYLCGEDGHTCEYSYLPNLFLREFH